MKTNGVNIPGRLRWHCVCESSLGSEKPWIHAGSQGAILDQSIWRFGRLHSGSCCSPYTPFLSVSTQSGAKKIYRDRSNKFGTGTMFDQDIKGLVKYVWWRYTTCLLETLSSLISCLVLPQISLWLRWWETHKIQSTHTHTAKIQLIHTSWQPLYLIACLALLLFHSHNQIQWHELCVCGGRELNAG